MGDRGLGSLGSLGSIWETKRRVVAGGEGVGFDLTRQSNSWMMLLVLRHLVLTSHGNMEKVAGE